MHKVVIIHNRMVIGGPAVAIAETIRKLNNQFEFFLIVGNPLPDEMNADYMFEGIANLTIIKIAEMNRMPNILKDFKTYFELKKIIKKIAPSVVHTHGTKPGLIGRLVASKLKVPTIIHTFHGHIFKGYFNSIVSKILVSLEKYLAKKSTAIIVISNYLQNEIVNTYKITDAQKVKTIPLALDLKEFIETNNTKRTSFREKYKVNELQTAIGIIGRITAIKNMQLFVNTIVELKQEYQDFENLKFFIVGDGIEKEKLEQILISNKIKFANKPPYNSENIIFTSWIKNMDDVMNGMDIVCLTSINEGTPVCLIEAMANKKPIVTTNAGSVCELVQHNKSGFIAQKEEEFKTLLQKLIIDKILQLKMGEMGQQFIKEKYTSNSITESMVEIYTQ